MTRRRNKNTSSAIYRIERKCNRLLAELIVMRQQLRCRDNIDGLLNDIHKSAREMRKYARLEKEIVMMMLSKDESL